MGASQRQLADTSEDSSRTWPEEAAVYKNSAYDLRPCTFIKHFPVIIPPKQIAAEDMW